VTSSRQIPVDSVLPFLATALNDQAMQRTFAERLRGRHSASIDVTACKIERVKYRAQRNCIIGYKLKICDEAGEHEQRLCAGVYATDDANARFNKAVSEATIATPYFAPVTLIAPLNMVIWTFPNDRKLTALPLLADAARLRREVLPEVVQARWGDGWRITDLHHTVSNYFPEHTCCVSVTLMLTHDESAAHRTWEIIGKTRYDDAGAETYRQMAAFSDEDDADVSYARPIAYQSKHRLLWQERVPGVTLMSLLASHVVDNQVPARVARAVAALHGTPVKSPRRITLSDLIDQLIAASKVIVAAHPRCEIGLRQIVDFLIANSGRLNLRYEGAWHGDLHSNNVLVSPTKVYLVDMDRVSIGPPLAELGSFLAELIGRACLNGEPLDEVQPMLTVAVAAYRQCASWPVSEPDVAWFTASALIYERALRCVTSLKRLRMDTIENLIAVATRIAVGGSVELAGVAMCDSMEKV
jgi:aminoglycoside phosphotransferase (APT) family kinase protein